MEICHSPLHLPPRDTRSKHVPDKLGKSAYGPRSLHVQILWISLVGGLRQCLTSNCLAIFGPSPQPAAALRAASRVSGVGFSFCRSLTERIPKRVEIHEICHLGPLRERREKPKFYRNLSHTIRNYGALEISYGSLSKLWDTPMCVDSTDLFAIQL